MSMITKKYIITEGHLFDYDIDTKQELILCKDCKYRDPEDKKCDCGMPERQGCIFPVADDYFCLYGEPRER